MKIKKKVLYAVVFLLLLFGGAQLAQAVSLGEVSLFSAEKSHMIHMIRTGLYVPSVLTSDSTNPKKIFMSSAVAASATGLCLIQELLKEPATPVWKQLFVNIPLIASLASALIFDVVRMMNAAKIAEKNKDVTGLLNSKVHQAFCLAIEFFLYYCSWDIAKNQCHKNRIRSLDYCTYVAHVIEQWRLASRWFLLHSAVSDYKQPAVIQKIVDFFKGNNKKTLGLKRDTCELQEPVGIVY